ncbi:MAG: Na/Pi symporter, partial [Bacteroidetes bacterium]|nr:Na/Pi symporter [Bacteroidota bacterium]
PWLLLILALVVLFISLKFMVGSLKTMVVAKAQNWFDKYLFKNALRAFIVGIFLTVLVQSSSITTSLMVPLAGAGILTLKKIFPYTLGANIGTTITAMLASLITGSQAAVTVAFSHLLFNISGIVIWAPLSKVPIYLAEKFAELSTKNKMIPVAYILVMFFVIPISIIFIFN